ncbi:MAG: NADP-dependent malic enzyme [Candidatus Bipolaricaulota bacterium]|nr:NADP-dependent malic enzyme [Candidatus Bipolaricaulota bacterium]
MSDRKPRPSEDERVRRAAAPGEKAPRLHAFYRGKIEASVKCAITSFDDLSIWYTPGVAAPCKEIAADPAKLREYTNVANAVAVVSDGSRVLGLGNIGARASLPVMEGKALLFKYLGGVGAFPVVLDTQDEDEIVQAVRWIAPGFGGINLEDIATPKCFPILERLRAELDIPVWHDDQQGTAAVTLAGLLNALEIVGKHLDGVTVALLGVGAAGAATLRVLVAAGVVAGNVRVVEVVDGQPTVLGRGHDLERLFPHRGQLLAHTNADGVRGSTPEALAGADVVIAFTRPGPDTIRKEWIRAMNPRGIGFFMANPVPEIWPWDAAEAGLAIVGTGRGDFPNQVNNSLGFPGIFRGTLDVCATTITDEMAIAAAGAIAKTAADRGLREDSILPTMMETETFVNQAVAVGMKAIEQGIARRAVSAAELRTEAELRIRHAQNETLILQREGIILPPPTT